METVPSFGTGAVCPVHGTLSVGACARCGRFMCGACQSAGDPVLCNECSARGADAMGLGTQGLTLGNALGVSVRLMRLGAPVIAGAALLGAVVSTALEKLAEASGRPRLGNALDRLYDFSIGQVLTIAVLATLLGAAGGRPLGLGGALREGVSAWGRVFVARFRAGLLILLFTLLLIVPGILKALSLAFVTLYAWKNDVEDPLEASKALTLGRRGAVFAALCVAFLIFMVGLMPAAVVVGMVTEVLPGLDLPLAYALNVLVLAGSHYLDAMVVACFLLLTNEKARAAA